MGKNGTVIDPSNDLGGSSLRPPSYPPHGKELRNILVSASLRKDMALNSIGENEETLGQPSAGLVGLENDVSLFLHLIDSLPENPDEFRNTDSTRWAL